MVIIGVMVGKQGRRKAGQQKQSVKSLWRRYGFWILGATVAITTVVIVIFASQGDGNHSTTSATPISSPSEVPRISPEKVKGKLDTGSNLIIIDTRSKAEYEQTHISGAVSVPLDEIAQRYSELSGYTEIFTYCT